MGEFCGTFRLVLQVASLSLLCAPLLCEASTRIAACEPCVDATVADGSAPSKAPPPVVAPVPSEQIRVEESIEAPGADAAPMEPVKIENNAVVAALADGVSTKLALAAGGVEGNALAAGFPLGLVGLTGAKILIVKYAETLPEPNKRTIIKTTSATWGGAAVNNLLVMLAAPTPLAIVAGVVMGIITWRHTAAQYDNQDRLAALQKEKQDRLAALQKEKQDRLAAMPKERPAPAASLQEDLETPQAALTAAK